MTYTYSVNNNPATGAVAMYTVLSTLVTAGWLVKADSDGTTYASSGGQITGGASGTHGLGNSKAWFRIQAPVVGTQKREFTFQCTTVGTGWRVKYSPSAGFTGGSPGATQTPTASDEVLIMGSALGTDSSPTGVALFGTDAGYRFSIVAGDSTASYGFYWFANNIYTTTISSGFLLDIMKSGSYPSADTDPCVIYYNQGQAFSGNIFSYTSGKALLNTTYQLVSTSAVLVNTTTNSTDVLAPPTVASSSYSITNQFTYGDNLLPVLWGRDSSQSSPYGMKGISTFLLAPLALRNVLDTISVNTTNDYIVLGLYALKWGSGTIPQL